MPYISEVSVRLPPILLYLLQANETTQSRKLGCTRKSPSGNRVGGFLTGFGDPYIVPKDRSIDDTRRAPSKQPQPSS